jgi:hypothetical protein
MNPERLLRLYPRAWRERYGDEFLALLQNTPVGLRVLIDVAKAAALEWARVVAPTVARFVGFYCLIWLTVLGMQTMIRVPHPLHLFDSADQARFLGTFLWSALVARFVDNRMLDGSPPPASRTAVQVLGALENLAAYVAVYTCWTVAPRLVVPMPMDVMVVITGNLFGRRKEMISILNRVTPGWTPRPPSITGLGLSA